MREEVLRMDHVTRVVDGSACLTDLSLHLFCGEILGLLCIGLSPLEACIAGAHIHGLAGDTVSEQYSLCGNTPSKMLKVLPKLLSQFE